VARLDKEERHIDFSLVRGIPRGQENAGKAL
jgi:hypothetical protein